MEETNVSFIVKETEAREGSSRVTLQLLGSNKEPVHNNELLNILNVLTRTSFLTPPLQTGFDYTLDFEFEE